MKVLIDYAKTFLLSTCMACGMGETVVVEKEVPAERPTTPSIPGTDNSSSKPISYSQMQGLLATNCSSCHANAPFMQSEAQLRNSRVKSELTGKSMPPNRGALSEGDRTLMVNFFR